MNPMVAPRLGSQIIDRKYRERCGLSNSMRKYKIGLPTMVRLKI